MSTEGTVTASFSSPRPSLREGFAGVLRMELQLACREPSLPLVLVGLLAFCQLLMPPTDAPYAVLTVNHLKPLMSANPMILATAALFGAVAFPAYLLYLSRARSRDLSVGLAALYLSSPISAPLRAVSVTFGRIVANMLLALSSLWIVLPLLLLSIRLKTGEWPDVLSIVAFFGLSVPVVITAAGIASILDAWTNNPGLKTTLALGLWFALLGLSISFQQFDFFGLRFIGENIFPGQPTPSLAVGFISGNVRTVPWTTVHETSTHLWGRFQLLSVVGGMGTVAALGLAATFRWGYAPTKFSPFPTHEAGAQPQLTRANRCLPQQVVGRQLQAWQTVALIARRRLRHAKGAKLLMATAALLGVVTRDFSVAATIALLVPTTLFGQHSSRTIMIERAVRWTTGGLWKPTPAFLEMLALWVLVVLPVLPVVALSQTSLLQCVHFLVGALMAAAWITFTHQILTRELLGFSVYLFVWYCVGCNRVPPMLDVLGLHASSALSFLTAIVIAGVLCLAISREGYRK